MHWLPTVAALGILLLVAPAASFAVPLIYTFEGEVTFSSASGSPLPDVPAVGDPVVYSFEINFFATGFITENGARFQAGDFFVDYLGGSAVEPTWVDPTHTLASNYGINFASHGQIVGSVNDVFSQSILIENLTLPVEAWFIGTTVGGVDSGADAAGSVDYLVFSDLTLTSIVVVDIFIPEPSTVLLMGAGFLALAVRKLRD